MGGELLSSFPDEEAGGDDQETFPLTELFEKCCPYYLSLGMSLDEYWRGEAELPRYYREAAEIQRKRINAEQWRMGMYMTRAIASALNGKDSPYPDEPFPLSEEESEEQKERRKRANYERIRLKMMNEVDEHA